jgi:hypothetical protein
MWITFAPGAFVWHHRRQTPRTYLKQQAGYGEAEALLRFKHPDKYTGRGDGKWRGVLYGPSLKGLRITDPVVYRGTFGTGLFQCIYRAGPAHWTLLPSTLEWHLAAGLLALTGLLFWSGLVILAAIMLAMSFTIATVLGAQARLAPEHDRLKARWLIIGLSYLQPLVRSWSRYRTRLFAYRQPKADPEHSHGCYETLSLWGRHRVSYWSEVGSDRTELLGLVIAYLNQRGWGKTVDSGWSDWDLEIYCHPWTIVQVCTAQEEHGSGKRLVRVRYRLRASGYMRAVGTLATLAAVIAVSLLEWAPFQATSILGVSLGGWAACFGLWWRGTRRASQAVAVFDFLARSLGLLRCGAAPAQERVLPGALPIPEPADAAVMSGEA